MMSFEPVLPNCSMFIRERTAPFLRFCWMERGKEMSNKDNKSRVGERWAAALKKRYGDAHTAKKIAKDFDIEPRTAKSWLGGQAPYAGQIEKAGEKFGLKFLIEVLNPGIPVYDGKDFEKAFEEVKEKIEWIQDQVSVLRRR